MSLVKSQDAAAEGRVRSLRAPPRPPPAAPAPDPALLALRAEVEALRAEAARAQARAEAAAAETKAQLSAAVEAAHAAGLEAGRAQAAEAGARLEAGLTAARAQLAGDLKALEGLAARMARAALGRVLDDPAEYPKLVEGALRRQMAALTAETVLAAEVSAADFPDPDALSALGVALGEPPIPVRAAPGLAAGDCRLVLQLGGLELGVSRQWARLKALLDELFEDGSPA